jgi:hypothetical protein
MAPAFLTPPVISKSHIDRISKPGADKGSVGPLPWNTPLVRSNDDSPVAQVISDRGVISCGVWTDRCERVVVDTNP